MFSIAPVEEHGAASGAPSRLDVLPAIANHDATGQVDVPSIGSLQQQARCRFPAATPIRVVVRTDQDIVDGDQLAQPLVDRVYCAPRLTATGDVRLIGDHDEEVPRRSERIARGPDCGEKLDICGVRRRVRAAVAHDGSAEDTVSVEKDRAPARRPIRAHANSGPRACLQRSPASIRAEPRVTTSGSTSRGFGSDRYAGAPRGRRPSTRAVLGRTRSAFLPA